MQPEAKPAQNPNKPPPPPNSRNNNDRREDFLLHLEAFLARRDGVDKLLKISRYAAKLALASSLSPPTLSPRLKSFESSVALSRKAFRLGKFVQDINALRAAASRPSSALDLLLSVAACGGEGIYYFLEQIVWLSKAGILAPELARRWQRVSAWAELVGYVGSIALKVKEVRKIGSAVAGSRGGDEAEVRKLRDKLLMKRLSLVQDVADGMMVVGDVRDGKGVLTDPLVMASAGMLSALISAHKNWVSC